MQDIFYTRACYCALTSVQCITLNIVKREGRQEREGWWRTYMAGNHSGVIRGFPSFKFSKHDLKLVLVFR